MAPTPEELARDQIDRMLRDAGWVIQDLAQANVSAARGVAIRSFPLRAGHGFADYLLYVDGKAAGVVEAKKQGTTLTGVEVQSNKYSEGLPAGFPAHVRPLPFCYESTGVETRFTNGLDPEPRSRPIFSFHRPECLAGWIADLATFAPLPCHLGEVPIYKRASTIRAKVRTMPPLITEGLWPPQVTAIRNLELSLAEDRPRAQSRVPRPCQGTWPRASATTGGIRWVNRARYGSGSFSLTLGTFAGTLGTDKGERSEE